MSRPREYISLNVLRSNLSDNHAVYDVVGSAFAPDYEFMIKPGTVRKSLLKAFFEIADIINTLENNKYVVRTAMYYVKKYIKHLDKTSNVVVLSDRDKESIAKTSLYYSRLANGIFDFPPRNKDFNWEFSMFVVNIMKQSGIYGRVLKLKSMPGTALYTQVVRKNSDNPELVNYAYTLMYILNKYSGDYRDELKTSTSPKSIATTILWALSKKAGIPISKVMKVVGVSKVT